MEVIGQVVKLHHSMANVYFFRLTWLFSIYYTLIAQILLYKIWLRNNVIFLLELRHSTTNVIILVIFLNCSCQLHTKIIESHKHTDNTHWRIQKPAIGTICAADLHKIINKWNKINEDFGREYCETTLKLSNN